MAKKKVTQYDSLIMAVIKVLIILNVCFITMFAVMTSVSAHTFIGEIPDICLTKNLSGYPVWLTDYVEFDHIPEFYYNFDHDEDVRLYVRDPTTNYIQRIFYGYATIISEKFEVGLHVIPRPGTAWDDYYDSQDVILIDTYSEDVTFSIRVRISTDESQSFDVNVRDTCVDDPDEVNIDITPVHYNTTYSLFDDLIHYNSFDYTLYDPIGLAFAEYKHTDNVVPTYMLGVDGGAVKALDNRLTLPDRISQITNGSYAFSFWFNYSDNSRPRLLFCGNYNDEDLIIGYNNNSENLLYCYDGTCYSDYAPTSDSAWHHFVISYNGTTYETYLDNGNYTQRVGGIDDFSHCYIDGDMNSFTYHPELYMDEFLVFNRSLNSSDVSILYDSGGAFDMSEIDSPHIPEINQTINTIHMNGSQVIALDMNQYFKSWQEIFINATDPTENRIIRVPTGRATGWYDWYDVAVSQNGTIFIESYNRTFEFNIDVYACNYTPLEECSVLTFTVDIDSELSQVEVVLQLEAYYDLGYTGYQYFSMNEHFRYYDRIIFAFPETNNSYPDFGHVGPLNGTWEFMSLENPINNASFIVLMECEINQEKERIHYLGDLNITMECGGNNTYFYVAPYFNYNQEVSFVAFNDISSEEESTTILAGNYNLPTGYIPSNITSNETGLQSSWYTFGELLPRDLEQKSKYRVVWFMLIIINVLIFIPLFRFSVPLALNLCVIVSIMILFLFVNHAYITPIYPILLLFLYMSFIVLKLFRGGM